MVMDTESELTITTDKTDVASLSAGDLVHVGFPLPHPRVVNNELRAIRVVRYRRSVITLVDSEGVEKRFRLSPARSVNRVTNPAIPVGPWNTPESSDLRMDVSEIGRSWQREDALWYKLLAPLGRPFVRLGRELLDMQCRAYSLRLRAGFWGTFFVILVAAVGIATQTDPERSVALSIVGAFFLERCWEWWRRKARRKLANGVAMRVRYKPFGPDDMKYGTLRMSKTGAVILDPDQTSLKPWSSTELHVCRGKRVLARCVFANDIRGDLRFTCGNIAEAIRHRIDHGSRRVIYATSTKYDPEHDKAHDITLTPGEHGLGITFRDEKSQHGFSVRLKFHQARVLADALEVMDDMRRL